MLYLEAETLSMGCFLGELVVKLRVHEAVYPGSEQPVLNLLQYQTGRHPEHSEMPERV
jgi:hypothetical protein